MFKLFIFVVAFLGFGISFVSEKNLLVQLARFVGRVNAWFRTHPKQRKKYKLLEEDLRM